MGKQLFDLYSHKCEVCGKQFEARLDYVYKEGRLHKKNRYFCSWRCMQQWRQNKRKVG